MDLVYRNNVICEKKKGIYTSWNCAKNQTAILNEIEIDDCKITEEEKKEIIKDCLDNELIWNIKLENKCVLLLTDKGLEYRQKSDAEKYIINNL